MDTSDMGGAGGSGGYGSTGSGAGGSGYGSPGGAGVGGSFGALSGGGSGYTTGGAGAAGAAGSGADDEFGVYDTRYYRGHFDAQPAHERTYEQARAGYLRGHTAAANPAYQGRRWEEVEVELEGGYQGEGNTTWENVREYARHAFEWRTLLGGLALAAGGWWAGKQLLEAWAGFTSEDETHYRAHYEQHPARATVTYDRARTGYALGHVAARNPAYAGRTFDEVEPEIRGGFTGAHAGGYDSVRDFCRYGYERGASTAATGGTGARGTAGGPDGMGTTGTTGTAGSTGM